MSFIVYTLLAINVVNVINNVYITELINSIYRSLKMRGKTVVLAKLVRVSDRTYEKLQKAQRVRESYGDVVDRAVDALLEKEGQ
jgi:hypothetical protein